MHKMHMPTQELLSAISDEKLNLIEVIFEF